MGDWLRVGAGAVPESIAENVPPRGGAESDASTDADAEAERAGDRDEETDGIAEREARGLFDSRADRELEEDASGLVDGEWDGSGLEVGAEDCVSELDSLTARG